MNLTPEQILEVSIKRGKDFIEHDVIVVRGVVYLITNVELPGQITAVQLKRPNYLLETVGTPVKFSLGNDPYEFRSGLTKEYGLQTNRSES